MTMNIPPSTLEQLLTFVSRETLDKLNSYITLLTEWNRNTSLVQIKTIDSIWSRHVLDSLQILPYLKKIIQDMDGDCQILDVGSGAGFPGMVLAIAGIQNITLCESNIRKCVFLEEVTRLTGASVTIENRRVEELEKKYDLVISRACADLSLLLSFAYIVSRETHLPRAVFHKGQNVNKEILEANKKWSFSFDQYPSILDSEGCILEVFDIKPK
jgi:16S rRNA (guanine527-N7)-methyltransferase